jgi:DNA-binding LacI/PurR family transcriptional regulator
MNKVKDNRKAVPRSLTAQVIAEKSGVNQSTVSRVLSGDPRITEATARKVRRVCRELGYVRDHLARGFRARKSYTVGLHIPFTAETVFSDPFIPAFLHGIRVAAAARNYGILLSYMAPDEPAVNFVNIVKGRRADGLILASLHEADERVELLKREGIPAVAGKCSQELTENLACVDIDNHHSGYQAARFVLIRGCRKLVLLVGNQGTLVDRDFRAGVEAACAAGGIASRDLRVCEVPDQVAAGRDQMKAILAAGNPPDAVVVQMTMPTLGVLRALENAGDKILVVGMGSPLLSQLYPGVPCVVQPAEELGREAFNSLYQIMAGEGRPADKFLYNHIVDEKGWTFQECPGR